MLPAPLPVAFDWRRANGGDVFTLAALYRDAALRLGPLVYTPAQVRAWASFADDEAEFRKYVLEADIRCPEDSAGKKKSDKDEEADK